MGSTMVEWIAALPFGLLGLFRLGVSRRFFFHYFTTNLKTQRWALVFCLLSTSILYRLGEMTDG